MQQRSRQREEQLRQRRAAREAEVRLLKQQRFGRKAEPAANPPAPKVAPDLPTPPRRRRGQQPGRPSPQRRTQAHRPAVLEECDLDDQACPHCGCPFTPFPGTAAGALLEVAVRAYRRVARRRRERPTCRGDGLPRLKTAPPPPPRIPQSHLGISVWVTVLLAKFASGRPTYRLLEERRGHGLERSAGTLTLGLRRLVPWCEPWYAALVTRSRQADHGHADETRWLVFVSRPGPAGHRG